MGNAAESRSNVDFQAFRTHFCLVSEQAAANFWPIILYRPDHVVLFVSKAMKEAADQLEYAVRTASPSTKIRRVSIEKVDDDNEVRSLVFELAFEFESSNPIVNVTGGTKLMAFGAREPMTQVFRPFTLTCRTMSSASCAAARRIAVNLSRLLR